MRAVEILGLCGVNRETSGFLAIALVIEEIARRTVALENDRRSTEPRNMPKSDDDIARKITVEIMKERHQSGAKKLRTLQEWEAFIRATIDANLWQFEERG